MKAKDLAKFLLQNPEAEVITKEYLGDNFYVSIDNAEFHKKGTSLTDSARSITGAVGVNCVCKSDVIYIGSSK